MTTYTMQSAHKLATSDASFASITTLMLSFTCIMGSPPPSLASFTFKQLLPSLMLDDDKSLLPLLLSPVSSLRDLIELIAFASYIPIDHIWSIVCPSKSALKLIKGRC